MTESAAAVPSERPMQPTSGMVVGADSFDDQASRSRRSEPEESQQVTGDAAIRGAAMFSVAPPAEAAMTAPEASSVTPAVNVAGDQEAAVGQQGGALPDVVSELKARLARVEAARDELARQQGQYKGIIAKVREGEGAEHTAQGAGWQQATNRLPFLLHWAPLFSVGCSCVGSSTYRLHLPK